MQRTAALIYGLIAYVVSIGTMLYLVGFLGNFLVPKSIDGAAMGGFWSSLLVNLGALALFGIQHSVMARQNFKKWWTRIIPRPIERSTYVLFSSIMLILFFWLWRPMPAAIWSFEGTMGQMVGWGLFVLGWLLVGVGSESIDSLHVNGIRQVFAYWRAEEYEAPDFQTPGPYQYIRHPLMLGFLIAFWATPHMTTGHLLFALIMTGYILVGIVFEERALIRQFGDRYRAYRKATPMLVPKPGQLISRSSGTRLSYSDDS